MPKIVVANLPVTTYVNAELEVEDGPDHTLHQRIADAARASRWQRARGRHEEEYEDLELSLDEDQLAYPLWSFEVLEGPAAPPLRLEYGTLPTREQFDAAWGRAMGGANVFSFENDPRIGTHSLTKDVLWTELQAAAGDYHKEQDVEATSCLIADAGSWCSKVLEVLGIEWV